MAPKDFAESAGATVISPHSMISRQFSKMAAICSFDMIKMSYIRNYMVIRDPWALYDWYYFVQGPLLS